MELKLTTMLAAAITRTNQICYYANWLVTNKNVGCF